MPSGGYSPWRWPRQQAGSPKPENARRSSATLALVGDRWSILIIRAALRGLRRFDDYQADLGIARPILTDRLQRLVEGGVMAKEPYQEHPPRYEYRLTPAGVALSPALVALIRWGEHHLADGERRHRAGPRPVRHRARAGVLVPALRHHVPTDGHPRVATR